MLEQLYEMNSRGRLRKYANGIYLGDGVCLETDDFKIRKIFIPDINRRQHFGCIGTTQIGKSKLILHLASQDILAGNSVGIFDPKGDYELLSGVLSAVVQAGRLDDFLFTSVVHPELSLKINPLAYYYIPDELIYHVIAGVQSSEAFFFGVARETTTAIINYYILKAMAKGKKRAIINFEDVAREADYASMEEVISNLQFYRNHPDPEVRRLADETSVLMQRIIRSGSQYYGEVTGSLRTALTALTTSVTGQIIGSARGNEIIKRIEMGKPIVFYCITADQITRFTAYDVARTLISMLHAMAGRITLSNEKFNPPFCLYFDEGDCVLYPGIESFFNKCGGANVFLHLFTQSFAQIEEKVGDKMTQSIIDNISTWVYMKVNDNKTAQYIEDSSPRKTVWKIIPSVGDSKATFTMREDEERVILSERVKRLKPRYFYLRFNGRYYKGMVPFVAPPVINIKPPSLKTAGEMDETD